MLRLKDESPLDIPVIIFHGKMDTVVSIKRSKSIAKRIFKNLIYNTIEDDDHFLKKTVQTTDWEEIIKN